MDVLVGRQPILDQYNRTVAYELLFRSGSENRFDGTEGHAATRAVISNTFLAIGSRRVLGAKRGFINFTRELLVEDFALVLPKDRVVIEVLEDVVPDAEVIESCRKLRRAGYRLALDDITMTTAFSPLTEYAYYAKLDWLAIAMEDRQTLCHYFRNKGLRVLAEKVETKSDFDTALSYGCELFQGFHFARPEIITSKQVPTSKLACMRLVAEIQGTELNFERLGEIIRVDVGLTQKLLRFANSPLFSHQQHITTLSEALVYVGEDNVRRWAAMASLPELAKGKAAELVTIALTRARFCELAAEHSRLRARSLSCFLIGLLSLIDAMIGRPLDELTRELGLEPNIGDAVMGICRDGDHLGSVLPLAVALERADIEAASRLAAAIGLSPAIAGELHMEAMTWADSLPR